MPEPMRRQSVAFIEALTCRECARVYPAEALHVCDYCFGPLEVAYDYEAIAAHTTRESVAAGPRSSWR
jgi:threonine synthase